MKLSVRTFLMLSVGLLGLTFTALAAASAPRTSTTVTAGQVYRIDAALYKAEENISVSAVALDERRVEARMTTCLSKSFVTIFEAVQTKSNPHAGKAVYPISAEAGAEYEMASIRPVINPLLNSVRRLLKLPLPASVHSSLTGILPAFAKVQSLNVCADARAWLAAGLVPAREPDGTRETAVAISDIHKITASTGGVGVGGLTPSELGVLKLGKELTGKHVDVLGKQSEKSLKTWITKLINGVEHTVQTTPTSTTARQTRTT